MSILKMGFPSQIIADRQQSVDSHIKILEFDYDYVKPALNHFKLI
jgi:hypothetical protein